MRNAFIIAGNNIRRILKKKVNYIVYIFLPPALAILFTLIISSGQSSAINIGVADNDNSLSSENLISYLQENKDYSISVYSEEDLKTAVGSKSVRAGINIPEGFGRYLRDGGDIIPVEIMSIEGVAVTGWLKGFLDQKIAMMYRAGKILENGENYDAVITVYSDKYVSVSGEEVLDITNKVSGTRAGFGMYTFASLFGIWAICALGFREKIYHTYQRIMSGPVAPWQYMVGNTLACMFFAMLHAVISITALYQIFNLSGILPLGYFVILIIVFYIAVIPLGLFLVSLGKSESAVMAVNVVFLTLTCMLGGCYWEVEFMPDFMQKIARGTIQFWFTNGITGLMKGNGIGEISTNIIVLVCCGIGFTILYVIIENSRKNRMVV
ncbi:MAG: ABC transporter permease [Clostridiales bacterium]|nr:ABC transporter permease [Clostridiales bacterium]